MAELVEAGAPAAELRPLRTQLELLEVYWQRRVRSPNVGSDARERLARRLCESAVGALALFAPREQLASDAPADQAIAELLSGGVLVEAQGPSGVETLAFSHHVLFDYALARLMLRVGDTELAGLLRERPELALIARPSLTLHFQWCWERDREMFWRLTFELAADVSLPLLGRLVAPAVAAQATAASELRPLTQSLAEPGPGREGAKAALVHVIGAALAGGSQQRPLENARVDVWSEFADQLSEQPDEHIVTNVRILTWGLLEERERLGDQERAAIGRVGRRLLRRALQEETSRGDLVYVGLNAVASTFDTDPAESRELLAEFVARERISDRGWEELHWIIEVLFNVIAEVPGAGGQAICERVWCDAARRYDGADGWPRDAAELDPIAGFRGRALLPRRTLRGLPRGRIQRRCRCPDRRVCELRRAPPLACPGDERARAALARGSRAGDR